MFWKLIFAKLCKDLQVVVNRLETFSYLVKAQLYINSLNCSHQETLLILIELKSKVGLLCRYFIKSTINGGKVIGLA